MIKCCNHYRMKWKRYFLSVYLLQLNIAIVLFWTLKQLLILGLFKTFNMNIKQDCCRKVRLVRLQKSTFPEPLFHMRPLGHQDVLKLFSNSVSIGIPDKAFFFFSKTFFKTLNNYWRRVMENQVMENQEIWKSQN